MTDDPFLAPPGNAPQPLPVPQAPAPYQPPAGYIPPAPVEPSYPQEYDQPGYAQQGYSQPGYPAPMPPPMPYYGQLTLPKTWMNWAAFGCGLGALVTGAAGGIGWATARMLSATGNVNNRAPMP